MQLPSLVIQTVCFHDSDKPAAADLGGRLYDLLTRPRGKPLAHGPGIPVYHAVSPLQVNLKAADKVVLLPVLGRLTHARMREEVVRTLKAWHDQLGDNHVIPVPRAEIWREEAGDLPVHEPLTQLYDKDYRYQRTLDEIIIAIVGLFDPSKTKTRLFLSHAKSDLPATKDAAEAIRDYIAADTTARAFFDVNSLRAGIPLRQQIDAALQSGVFIAIRTDHYNSKDWCLHELLQAKRNSLPTLTVEILDDGEDMSAPYLGNAPSVVWKPQEDPTKGSNPQKVVSRALVECLRAAHFQAEGRRIVADAGLPHDSLTLCRPPELLDLIQGPILRRSAQVVIHPDPELPSVHRELLAIAHPRLRLVTPTTAFRPVSDPTSTIASPFDGQQIGFSISESPDVEGPSGFAKDHIDDVAVYLARCLIAAGAHFAYGGDFRSGGYTEVFSGLISAYRQTAGDSDDILHSYLDAHTPIPDDSGILRIAAHELGGALSGEALLPAPTSHEGSGIPRALYTCDMRRVMTGHLAARIILGGLSTPQLDEVKQSGYRGLYPGVVEEAWWSMKNAQPVYVIGGFGGGAGILASLMEGQTIPDGMRDDAWDAHASRRDLVQSMLKSPWLGKLGLPAGTHAMARSIQDLAANLLADDAASLRWNGLTLAENRELWRTIDPLKIVTLIYKGLSRCRHAKLGDRLAIELVEGTVTAAQGLQAIAVTVFEGLPLGGAGAALDRLAAGRASIAHASGQALVSMDSAEIAADFLYLASLGSFNNLTDLTPRIRTAAANTTHCAQRHGFSRLGVISFGGAMATDLKQVADAMLDELVRLSGQSTVVWFENDPVRHATLLKILQTDPRVSLTTRRQTHTAVATRPERSEQLVLSVTLSNDFLTSTVMPPSGTGVVRNHRIPFARKDVLGFSRGASGRNTPPPEELETRGRALAAALLGNDAADFLARCKTARVMLIHDVASSQLPFEIMLAGSGTGEIRPALDAGLHRRLAVDGVTTQQLFAKEPHTEEIRVLVVINPLGDLPGAEEEGLAVLNALKDIPGVKPVALAGKNATKSAFLEAIATADVLHYCGHAFFDGPGAEESGLNLWGDPLFFEDLKGAPSALRIVFANACEAGRVRAPASLASEAASFAEFLLRTGIEAFLGTYWRVADTAAMRFAQQIYASLAQGKTLEKAVLDGRIHLRETGSAEWCNYVLYGEGGFRIVRR